MRFHSSNLFNSSHLRVRRKLGLQECLEVELGVLEIGNGARGLRLNLLGLGLLPPLGLGLLDQTLLAGVFVLDLGALSLRADRRLVVDTIDETGNESRVAEDVDTLSAGHFCESPEGWNAT